MKARDASAVSPKVGQSLESSVAKDQPTVKEIYSLSEKENIYSRSPDVSLNLCPNQEVLSDSSASS